MVVESPMTRTSSTRSAIERLRRRFRQRRVDQFGRVGAEIETARTVPALVLNHADEGEVVDRIDPEPGAGRAAPIEGAVAERQAGAGGLHVHREVEAEADRLGPWLRPRAVDS